MARTQTPEMETTRPATALRLWIGILVPPMAALIQLQALWLTSEFGCRSLDFTWNHVASIVAIAASAAAGLLAYSEFRRFRSLPSGDVAAPQRFMAMIGMIGGLLFTLWTVAMWVPTLMGVPCDK